MTSEMPDGLIYNDQLIELLSQSIHKGSISLKHVPDLMKDIIVNNRWRKRKIRRTGEIKEFTSFVEFVNTKPLEGLGANVDVIITLCSEEPAVVRMIKSMVETDGTEVPNKYPYLVKSIEKLHPDLAEQIKSGGVSVIEIGDTLGFQLQRPRLNVVDIEQTADRIIEAFNRQWGRESKEALAELIKHLQRHINY